MPSFLDLTRCGILLKGWLHECNTNHSTCSSPSLILPKRFLCVSVQVTQVIDTKGLPSSRYMTLSHCWGKNTDMITTTKDNIERRRTGIEWNELPQIFKDAITVTRSIECQWIWIDSLCIVQDDENDWHEESAKMAEIHSNSFLNIAATASPTSHGSLFSSRKCLGDFLEGYRPRYNKSFELIEQPNCINAGLSLRVSLDEGHRYIRDEIFNRQKGMAPLLQRA